MKKVLLSLLSIGAVGGVAVLATGAFFSDTETSSGNLLQAGAIDLRVDNTSYYNGVYSEETSWDLQNLSEETLFFNFDDLKPGDLGEDTISLHVGTNDAWVCVDIDVTANDDFSSTEPELEALDDPEDPTDDFDGELASALNFIFWVDDGDNVLEVEEQVLTQGPASDVLDDVRWAIADSDTGEPLTGDQTYYIGKAWCFGDLTEDRELQDGPVVDTTPADGIPDNGPDTRGAGVDCDGTQYGNIYQTDLLTGDIVFEAVQSRNNEEFLCNPLPE